jgi:hypothetical protein
VPGTAVRADGAAARSRAGAGPRTPGPQRPLASLHRGWHGRLSPCGSSGWRAAPWLRLLARAGHDREQWTTSIFPGKTGYVLPAKRSVGVVEALDVGNTATVAVELVGKLGLRGSCSLLSRIRRSERSPGCLRKPAHARCGSLALTRKRGPWGQAAANPGRCGGEGLRGGYLLSGRRGAGLAVLLGGGGSGGLAAGASRGAWGVAGRAGAGLAGGRWPAGCRWWAAGGRGLLPCLLGGRAGVRGDGDGDGMAGV